MADVSNPLFDGNLSVTIGALNVTSAVLPGLTYSTTMPGGFGEASFALPASSPWSTYNAAVVRGASVTIAHSSTTLFEGKITNDCTHATIRNGEAVYEVTAAGLWYWASVRQDFCRGYVDADTSQWQVYSWSHKNFETTVEGYLDIRLSQGNSCKSGKKAAVYYWLHNGLSTSTDEYIDHIEGVADAYANSNWSVQWHSGSTPWASGDYYLERDDTAGISWSSEAIRIPTTGSLNGTPQMFRLSLMADTDITATANEIYITLKKLRVYIGSTARRHSGSISTVSQANPTVVTTSSAHGLKSGDTVFLYNITGETPSLNGYHVATVTGSSTFTVPVNVTVAGTGGNFCGPLRVEEIMADAAQLTGLATSASTSQLTTAAPNGQKHAMARPFGTVAGFLDESAAMAGTVFNYGFWDSSAFEAEDRTASASGYYTIDCTTPGIDYEVFDDSEWAYDYVRILYKFKDTDTGTSTLPDGTLKTNYAYRHYDIATGAWITESTTDPGWTDMSKRVYFYDASEATYEDWQAQDIGEQLLAYIASQAYRGTITIATPTVNRSGTTAKNTAYMRAGEWIKETNHNVLLFIGGTDFNVDSGVMTLTIGVDPTEFKPTLKTSPSWVTNPHIYDRFRSGQDVLRA